MTYGPEYWAHVLNVENASWTDLGRPHMDDSDDEIILVKGPMMSKMD